MSAEPLPPPHGTEFVTVSVDTDRVPVVHVRLSLPEHPDAADAFALRVFSAQRAAMRAPGFLSARTMDTRNRLHLVLRYDEDTFAQQGASTFLARFQERDVAPCPESTNGGAS